MRSPLRFWGSAVLAAAAIALAAALLLPYGRLGLHAPAERERAWLLTVWTAGVLAVLFGATARLGARGVGMREVAEAGSVRAALETHRRAVKAEAGHGFDVWAATVGVLLIVAYFAGWMLLNG